MKYENQRLDVIVPDIDQRISALEGKGRAAPGGGWLFLGAVLGAGIVGCCWLLSLRQIREAPVPVLPPPAPISCDCGTVTLVNPQDWARVLFDPTGETSADGELVTLERLP